MASAHEQDILQLAVWFNETLQLAYVHYFSTPFARFSA